MLGNDRLLAAILTESANNQCLRKYIGKSAFADVSYLMADVEATVYV